MLAVSAVSGGNFSWRVDEIAVRAAASAANRLSVCLLLLRDAGADSYITNPGG
jgi:hypothetical protein